MASDWTIDTLREHMQRQVDDLHALLNERYETQVKALDAAVGAQQLAMQTAFNAADKAVTAALDAASRAVEKAEKASEKRFDAVNEFRGQLSDQITTFLPRAEAELSIGRNSDAIHQVSSVVSGLMGRSEFDSVLTRYNERLLELSDRVTKGEGHGSGLASGWLYLLGAIAAISTIVNIYLMVKGHS